MNGQTSTPKDLQDDDQHHSWVGPFWHEHFLPSRVATGVREERLGEGASVQVIIKGVVDGVCEGCARVSPCTWLSDVRLRMKVHNLSVT